MKVLYNTTPLKYGKGIEAGKVTNPSAITFAFIVGGTRGKYTCQAGCEYCFLPVSLGSSTYTPGNIDEKIALEKSQIADLRAQGFKVVPLIPDSFSWKGKYLKSGMLYKNAFYDQEGISDTGIAWTSGRPLLEGTASHLLNLAYESGLRIVAITSHGITDGEVPIRGTVPPSAVRKVLEVIHNYNVKNKNRQFRISLGFPIGKHNISRLADYIVYSALVGADYVRFNCILDLSPDNKFCNLVLSSEQIVEFFKKMHEIKNKRLRQLLPSASPDASAYKGFARMKKNIAIMVSTDFGFKGEEALSLSRPINRCPGGTNLFGIFNKGIYPCSELFDIPLGNLVRKKKSEIEAAFGRRIRSRKSILYTPEFISEKANALDMIVKSSDHCGCIAHTIAFQNLRGRWDKCHRK